MTPKEKTKDGNVEYPVIASDKSPLLSLRACQRQAKQSL